MLTETCPQCDRPFVYDYQGPRCPECQNVDDCRNCGEQAYIKSVGFCERCLTTKASYR